MSWFNHRPRGYKYPRTEGFATDVAPVRHEFDGSRRDAQPAAVPAQGAHERSFEPGADAANTVGAVLAPRGPALAR